MYYITVDFLCLSKACLHVHKTGTNTYIWQKIVKVYSKDIKVVVKMISELKLDEILSGQHASYLIIGSQFLPVGYQLVARQSAINIVAYEFVYHDIILLLDTSCSQNRVICTNVTSIDP